MTSSRRLIALGCGFGGSLDSGAVVEPELCVASTGVVGSARGLVVELFTQDVGVTGVAIGLGKQVNEDVEQLHVGPRPPRHMAGSIDVEGFDRGVGVFPTRQ